MLRQEIIKGKIVYFLWKQTYTQEKSYKYLKFMQKTNFLKTPVFSEKCVKISYKTFKKDAILW